MKKQLFKVWCEWDIGLENKVFETKKLALEAARIAISDSDIDDNFDELLEDGLVGVSALELN